MFIVAEYAALIWLGSFVIFQGFRTSIDKKPYIFVICQGVGVLTSWPAPLWVRACVCVC